MTTAAKIIPHPASARTSATPPTKPRELIEWMNDRYAIVLDGNKTVVIFEDSALNDQSILRCLTFQAFRDLYCNHQVYIPDENGDNGKRFAVGAYWLNDPRRRQYQGIVFDPTEQVSRDEYYNLWSGFSQMAQQQHMDYPRATWSLMQTHIHEIICRGNEEHYQYVLKWMAHAIYHPDEPAGTALVLRGEEGSGKGIFARTFGSLFGKHWLHLSDAQHLTGRFNGHLEGRIVIFADEAVGTSDKKTIGKLNALITEPTIYIEPKFRTPYTAKNHTHLIMASNEDWVVPAGKDARRYVVLDVSNTHKNDTSYFGPLNDELQHGGYGAMLSALHGVDLNGFNIFAIPKTAALLDQKLSSLSPEWQWWRTRLDDGRVVPSHTHLRQFEPAI